MGFSVKFNWVLQIDPPSSLSVGNCYTFKKDQNRIFPIDTPIDLIDKKRNAVAKIRIKSFLNEHDSTSGEYEVIKVYSATEKAVLSAYWRENL